MRSLTEVLRGLKDMIVESISYEPCSVAELKKRDFLKTTSSYGIEFCLRDLVINQNRARTSNCVHHRIFELGQGRHHQ